MTSIPESGGDDAPRIVAALARCPPVSCALRLPSGRLRLLSPIVLSPDRNLIVSGPGPDQSILSVGHTGIALTIVQHSACHATALDNITVQGDVEGSAPIAAGIRIDYSDASPCASPPPPITLRDVSVRAANDPLAFTAPYPGTFRDGVVLTGPFPHMLGGVVIDGLRVQPTLKAAPAAAGSHCLTAGLIDDLQVRGFTCLYADAAFWQVDYGEGFRFDTISWIGVNCGWCQGPAAGFRDPLGVRIRAQKSWINGAEINAYDCGICVASVSDSFIASGEIVRYADSRRPWHGVRLIDSYLWHFSNDFSFDNLVGRPEESFGIDLARTASGTCYQNGGIGNHFARLSTAIRIGPGCTGSQFLFPMAMDRDGAEITAYRDESGNATNRILWTQTTKADWEMRRAGSEK